MLKIRTLFRPFSFIRQRPLYHFSQQNFKGNESPEELKKMMDDQGKQTEMEDEESYVNESRKGYYAFMIASVGLIGGYFMMQLNQMGSQKRSIKPAKQTSQGKADIGGSFQLFDTEGKEFTDKDLKGQFFLEEVIT